MTDDFKKNYQALFEVIRENAPETKTIMTHRGGRLEHRAVRRRPGPGLHVHRHPATNAEITTPEVYKNQVTVTMDKVGDEWLVDDLKTTLPSS